jgi:L-threonylcarbamoyladenylate synthase
MAPIMISIRSPTSVEQAFHCLIQGQILLFPTETVYGLGVDSAQPKAIERLYEIKGRPKEKPFQWLIADSDTVRKNSPIWTTSAEKLAKSFWPGPLTLVLPSREDTVGWRIPNHDWLLGLLKKLGRPLISTSANLAGEPPALSCEEGIEKLGERIQMAIDGGKVALGKPSTVVRLISDKVEILREGAISKDEIFRATE